MKSLTFCLLICLGPILTFSQTSNSEATTWTTDDAEQWLSGIVKRKECIGLAAGFLAGDETHWVAGSGYRDQQEQLAFTPQTINRMASIVKPMTAIAIMQLYEQEKLGLDEPIQSYLPNFPVKAKGTITIRHLLGHLSGIGAYKNGKERENKHQYENLEAVLTIFQDRELLAEPGTDFNYSTYGYVVLGRIIEVVSGMSYEEYLRQHIWDKAGMAQTEIEQLSKSYPEKSRLYHRNHKGKIKTAKPTNLSDRIPGGGVHSTLEDLLKFGAAVLDHQLLKPETLELMWTFNGVAKKGNPYGLGWYLYGENPRHGNVVGHTGTQTGCSAFLLLLPEEDTVIVVLANTSGAMNAVSNLAIRLMDVAAHTKTTK